MVSKTIGIIGGKGFIGSNLVSDLNATCIDRTYDGSKKFDILINASGNSSKLLPDKDPLQDFDLTVRNTLNLVNKFDFDTFVHISSCEVYSKTKIPFIDYDRIIYRETFEETSADANLDVTKMSRYGFSKYLAECIVKKYCKKWIILRLNGPIGPNLKKGPVYDVYCTRKLWISPTSELQLIHTKYISLFIKNLLNRNVINETFNLTGDGTVNFNGVIQDIKYPYEFPNEPIICHNININKSKLFIDIPSSQKSLGELEI
jgi:nucleoside-diphosphate-sugar epimerase